MDSAQELDALHPVHVYLSDDQIGDPLTHSAQARSPVLSLSHLVPGFFEQRPHDYAGRCIAVHNKYVCHSYLSISRFARASTL